MSAFTSQIIFHPGNCINAKKPFAAVCRQCVQMCPHDAINEKKDISKAKCTECGVCMAVCPSDGFVDRTMDDLKEHLFGADSVTLNCPAAQPGTYEISCLGMFDRDAWSTLILLSEHKELRLLTGDCASCQDLQACAISVGTLKDLLRSWTSPNNIKIEIMPWDGRTTQAIDGSTPEAPQSLGELREKKKLAKKLKTIVPALIADETYTITRTRSWLMEALEGKPERKIPFQALKIDDKCTACGVCARVCPQEALTHIQDNGTDRFVYQPGLCCHCLRCIKICGPKALTMTEMELDTRFLHGKVLLREIVPRFCSSCGHRIFHQLEPGLCIICARKDPELKGILY